MIEVTVERAQIGRDRAIGREFVQQVGLHLDESEDGVAAKAHPIQRQGGVVQRGRAAGHGNLVPIADDLAPVAGAGLLVEALNDFVFGLEP